MLASLPIAAGRLTRIRAAWQKVRIVPLAGAGTISELLRVLNFPKFALSAGDRREVLAEYLPWCETVTDVPVVDVPGLGDPSDRMFLDLAMAGAADAVITGDGELLVFSPRFSIPIISGRELMWLLDEGREG